MIDGDAAVGKQNWAEAAECYEKALRPRPQDRQGASGRRGKYARRLLPQLGHAALSAGQDRGGHGHGQEGLERPDFLQTKAAPGVAVFLLNVQYYQYLGAAEKTDAEKTAKGEMLKKVSTTAKSILNHWAAKEEGDAARIVLLRLALGQANLAEESAAEAASAAEKASRLAQAQAKMAEADKILSEINPDSREYPRALTVMGFAHWYKYKTAKKQIEPEEERIEGRESKEGPNRQGRVAAFDKAKANRDEHRRQALDFIEKAVNELAKGRVENAADPRGPSRIPVVAGRNLQRRRGLQKGLRTLQALDGRDHQRLQQAVRRNHAANLRPGPARPA